MASSNNKSAIHVLYVDDDQSLQELTKLMLMDLDSRFEIDCACCVDEALKKLLTGHFDVVVSDYEMPQKDGLQFLKQLHEQNNLIPFILFTGKGREEVAIKALNLGADGYINKQGSPETIYGELSHSINLLVDRYQAKQALQKSEARYRKLYEASSVGVVAQDQNGAIIEANSVACEMLGLTQDQIRSRLSSDPKWHAIREDGSRFPGNEHPSMVALHTGKPVKDVVMGVFNPKEGAYRWIQINAELMLDPATGHVKAAITNFIDVTQRKRVEDELKVSEERFRLIFEYAPDAYYLSDLKGNFVDGNKSAEDLTGYIRSELIGKSFLSLNLLSRNQILKAAKLLSLNVIGRPTGPDEFILTRKNGTHVSVEILMHPLNVQGKKIVLGIARDITGRKHIEESLKESEKKSRAIVACSPIGIATLGADKHFLSANEAFCRILGYTEDELRKLAFKDITHTEDLKESVIKTCELENGKISSFALEKRYVRKDGAVIDGKIMVSAVRDQNGKPCLFVAELEDITERKKAEDLRKVLERKVNDYSEHMKYMVELRTAQLKDANERLVKSERLAAIGELSGMVGHDLRNPLAGIKNATYYLKKKGTAISEAQSKEMLTIIEKAIDHSDKIINDLLDYAREMHLELTKYAAHTLVDEAIGMIQVPDRIQIANHVDEEVGIWVNTEKMMRVFINLIKNAVDAMPEKGILEISGCQTRDCVEITFADTGTGIPEETLQKLFTPLFTTKAQGMGFGLAICKRIIEAHEGTLTVKTKVNKGTTFTITLPLKPKANVECKKRCVNTL